MSNDSNNEPSKLFEEFPPVSTEAWEKRIRKDLGGTDYKEKLRWETGEGFDLLPFYRREHLDDLDFRGPLPSSGKTKNEWEICQAVFDADIDEARATASNALEMGADALLFTLRIHKSDGMLGGDIEGTATRDQESFGRLLKKIDLNEHNLHFDSGMGSPAILAMLANEIHKRQVNAESVSATLLFDPYAYILTSGQMPKEEKAFLDDARQMIQYCRSQLPLVRCLGVDARLFHNAGGTIPEELGFALAAASEYMAKLTDNGCDPKDIARSIHFAFSVGSNYFLEIAKFRAARFLWANMVNRYLPDESEAPDMYIRGESSRWNKTVYDPHTNMLRTTTEGMSAALAGCDSVTTLPFDVTFTKPGEFSQRIARNSQIILKEESYFNEVRDPAAGSYYIEKLTDKIAEKAWKQFQEVEKQGGMLNAIEGKYIQWAIGESREERNRSIANRERTFVGTNRYPNPKERLDDVAESRFITTALPGSENGNVDIDSERLIESMAEALDKGARLGDLTGELIDSGKHDIPTIHPYRGPQIYESLRMATEKHEDTPTVFLLPMGDPKKRKARSTFAANLFGTVGYHIDDHIGFDTVGDAAEAVQQSAPEMVVICSSDEEYEELVGPLCKRIGKLDPEPVIVLAGDPGDKEERYRNAGVHRFIHSNINVLGTLKELQREFGIID